MFVWQSTYNEKFDECESLKRKLRSLEVIHEGYKKECTRDIRGKIDNISALQSENDSLKSIVNGLESKVSSLQAKTCKKKGK